MSGNSSWPNWVMLAAITALAAVLRRWQINESLWVDELHTSWCVQGGFWHVSERATAGNQSPLHFYLVWGVTRLLGENEFTLRLPSQLAGIALPGMTWLLVRRVWRDGVDMSSGQNDSRNWSALLAAFLVAIDHTSIFYSTEARPYAVVQLLSIAVLIAALNVIRQPSAAAPLWFIWACAALFYLQYTSVLFLAAVMAALLIWAVFHPSQEYNWQSWLVDVGGTAAICAPPIVQLFDIAARRENWGSFIGQPKVADLVASYPWLAAPIGLLPLCFRTTSRPLPKGLALVCAAAVLPVLLAWGLSHWHVAMLFHPRYVIAALPAMWIAVAIATQLPTRRSLRIALMVMAAASALGWSGIAENIVKRGCVLTDRQEDWRSAIAAAEDEYLQHPGWRILVHSGLIETDALRQPHNAAAREYGLLPVKALYPLHVADEGLIPLPMSEPGKLTEETRAEVLKAGGTIVILRLSAERAVAVEDDLAGCIAEIEVVKRLAFGDLQVLTVRTRRK
jgi:mannosyltransferase